MKKHQRLNGHEFGQTPGGSEGRESWPGPAAVHGVAKELYTTKHLNFPGGAEVKASACNVADLGSIPGLGRSPGEGNGNPLQYSCLENPMDRGTWWATVHGVAKSWT